MSQPAACRQNTQHSTRGSTSIAKTAAHFRAIQHSLPAPRIFVTRCNGSPIRAAPPELSSIERFYTLACMQLWHERLSFMLCRFIIKENLYAEMDYPFGLRNGSGGMRYAECRRHVRFAIEHGFQLVRQQRDDAGQLRSIVRWQLRLRFERLIGHQPQRRDHAERRFDQPERHYPGRQRHAEQRQLFVGHFGRLRDFYLSVFGYLHRPVRQLGQFRSHRLHQHRIRLALIPATMCASLSLPVTP